MKVFNTLSGTKEEFVPRGNEVKMYVCGVTPYDDSHIGHAMSYVIFDVIRRYLQFKGYKVKYVQNITDIDDKLIDRAGKLGSSVSELAGRFTDSYFEDMDALNVGRVDIYPRATEEIDKIIEVIGGLIDKGYAYPAGGSVYFRVGSVPDYGKLSHRSLESMMAGGNVEFGKEKEHPLDFALWKAAKEDEPSWESPWGEGRPGWHIECSVMSSDLLGDRFDIHGGGIDLIFPHHENEIAQSEAAGNRFANLWMHNGLLTINSEKMAKSAGNFISIKDFLAKHKDADFLKLLFLNTHYRHPVDYTEAKIEEMRAQKERFVILLEKLKRVQGTGYRVQGKYSENFRKRFEEAMDDDFNTPLALAALFDLVTYANKLTRSDELPGVKRLLVDLSSVLGLELSEARADILIGETEIMQLLKKREDARSNRDFRSADGIRKQLLERGVILEDTKDGTVWRRRV